MTNKLTQLTRQRGSLAALTAAFGMVAYCPPALGQTAAPAASATPAVAAPAASATPAVAAPAASATPAVAAPAASATPAVAAPAASATPAVAAPAASAAPAAAAPNASATPTVTAPAPAAATGDIAALKAQLEAQAESIAALQEAAEEAEMAAMLGDEDEDEAESEKLRFYGFMDMGAQRIWADKKGAVGGVLPSNATSFVVGNINLYIDAEPAPNWRALTELHYTNTPQGQVDEYGLVLGGQTLTEFKRTNVEQFDPHAASLNTPLWAGSTAIERAWIEYNGNQSMKVRLGSFFTPFGIWNMDHGSPTLISLALPQLIVGKLIPMRQIGLQLYGNTFAGDWELGYHATVTNGRQELSNFDADDDKGYGGRLYATYQSEGGYTTRLGLSGFTGSVEDEQINITNVTPLTFERSSKIEYDEYVVGGDISVDLGALRLRAESVVQHTAYKEGKRPEIGFALPGYEPDKFRSNTYALAAYKFDSGFEPYWYASGTFGPSRLVSNAIWMVSPGLNVHLVPGVQLKFQYTYAIFRTQGEDYPAEADAGINDLNSLYGRLVVAF